MQKVFELRVRRVHKTETPLGKGERKIFGVCRGFFSPRSLPPRGLCRKQEISERKSKAGQVKERM